MNSFYHHHQRQIENRYQCGCVSEPISQALLFRADALITVEIEANGNGTTALQAVDATAEKAIVDRPAIPLDIAFLDPDHGDWAVETGGSLLVTDD